MTGPTSSGASEEAWLSSRWRWGWGERSSASAARTAWLRTSRYPVALIAGPGGVGALGRNALSPGGGGGVEDGYGCVSTWMEDGRGCPRIGNPPPQDLQMRN